MKLKEIIFFVLILFGLMVVVSSLPVHEKKEGWGEWQTIKRGRRRIHNVTGIEQIEWKR